MMRMPDPRTVPPAANPVASPGSPDETPRFSPQHLGITLWLVTAILTTGTILLALDLLWLSFVMDEFFRSTVGDAALRDTRLLPAALFYLGFVAALIWFAVLPGIKGGTLDQVALNGALIGLVAYGTYDLTNLATLGAWTWKLALFDMSWGAVVSALSAVAGFAAASGVAKRR